MKVPYWGDFYLKTAKPFFTPAVTDDDCRIICEGLKDIPSGKVLDLGCGHGRHIPGVCIGLKRNVIGVDFDIPSINEARASGCDVLQADICALPFDANTIAGAYCWSNTAFCMKPLIRQRVMREVARVLQVGGKFVCQSLAPDVALQCGNAGTYSMPLESGGFVKDDYIWNGEKLHVLRTMTQGETVESSEIDIYCPADHLVLAELKKFGLEATQLKHHHSQRVVTAVKF